MSKDVKPVVVTGANRGIGRATVEAVLDESDDTHALLGARSVERGEQARREIVAEHPDAEGRVDVVQLDVTDDASVREAAASVESTLDGEGLYGVVNNAGVGDRNRGVREVLDVNVYGPKRVCETFVPMIDHADGRVVNVSSAAGPKFVAECDQRRRDLLTDPEVTWADVESLMEEIADAADDEGDLEGTGIGNERAYGLSKACLNAYTMILAREHPELSVNACTPGFIETGMTRPMAERKGKDPDELGMNPPEEGTTAQMFLLFGEPEGTGWYFGSDAERSPLDRYRAPGDPPYTGD